MPNLRERLASGIAVAFRIVGTDAALVISTGTTKDSGASALWIEGVGGNIGFRPHQNRDLIRHVVGECEALAHRLGCSEMRIEAGSRLGWKARLLPTLGFQTAHVAGATFMRKAIS